MGHLTNKIPTINNSYLDDTGCLDVGGRDSVAVVDRALVEHGADRCIVPGAVDNSSSFRNFWVNITIIVILFIFYLWNLL